jgi:hypothetical protein
MVPMRAQCEWRLSLKPGGRKPRLEIFLHALLATEANTVGGGPRPTPHQSSRYIEIFFGTADPFTRGRLHT